MLRFLRSIRIVLRLTIAKQLARLYELTFQALSFVLQGVEGGAQRNALQRHVPLLLAQSSAASVQLPKPAAEALTHLPCRERLCNHMGKQVRQRDLLWREALVLGGLPHLVDTPAPRLSFPSGTNYRADKMVVSSFPRCEHHVAGHPIEAVVSRPRHSLFQECAPLFRGSQQETRCFARPPDDLAVLAASEGEAVVHTWITGEGACQPRPFRPVFLSLIHAKQKKRPGSSHSADRCADFLRQGRN
mmetsp:Transcript_12249/g.45402  ORF Transcript_12249/g.45402 Transcript_12249/m.45402 type:complete len:245 (+) Transcript_12249:884-1618(+)